MSSYSVESEQRGIHQSQWISSILSKAVAFWLRSQVESVEQLEVLIEAGNRDLLRGEIPQVTLKASHGIYQELHLSQIHLLATQIRTNLSQILKGKPLQLLEPIDVVCQLNITQSDLNASVSTPLLTDALRDILLPWLQSQTATDCLILTPQTQVALRSIQDLHPQQITFTDKYYIIKGILVCAGESFPFQLKTQLQLGDPQTLILAEPMVEASPLIPTTLLNSLSLDLGSTVRIKQLDLASEQLTLQGQIQVNP